MIKLAIVAVIAYQLFIAGAAPSFDAVSQVGQTAITQSESSAPFDFTATVEAAKGVFSNILAKQ